MIRNKKLILFIGGFLLLGTGFVLGIGFKRSDGKTFVEQIEGDKFPQQLPQDSSPAPANEDLCGQAKYQEACEAREGCLWIGCPNNVCVSNR